MESNTTGRPPIVLAERYILKVRNLATREIRVRELDLIPEHLESLHGKLNININGYKLESLHRKVGNE